MAIAVSRQTRCCNEWPPSVIPSCHDNRFSTKIHHTAPWLKSYLQTVSRTARMQWRKTLNKRVMVSMSISSVDHNRDPHHCLTFANYFIFSFVNANILFDVDNLVLLFTWS